MKHYWKRLKHLDAMSVGRWVFTNRNKLLCLAASGSAAALVLISCTTTGPALMAPPDIPGAEFVGSDACSECHDKVSRDFRTADHARLQAKGENAKDMGCESCHGPGSKHKESGGALRTIVNPKRSPEACLKCHLDVRASFMLPYTHQVLNGKMTCTDCHDPHKGSALKGGGTQIERTNDTCFQCHTQQRGPFVFPHDATREGCTSCHSPHGSVNQKMLAERNNTLCLKCHFQAQTQVPATPDALLIGSSSHSGAGRLRSACWSSGCHEGVHGSNVNHHLRN